MNRALGTRVHTHGAAFLLTLVLALAVTAAPAGAADTYPGRIGVATHLRYFTQSQIDAEFARLDAGGVNWVREDFPWWQLEPQPGVEDWTMTDRLMAAAAKNNISVLALVSTTPPWASGDPSGAGDRLYPPRDPSQFAAFNARIVTRYGSNGTFWATNPGLPKHPLKAIEVWNEPWCRCAWKPDPSPAGFAALARQTMQTVRSIDPSVKLLISADWWQSRVDPKPIRWLEALLDADPTLPSLADGWVVHPYPAARNLGPYDESYGPYWAYSRVVTIHNMLVDRHVDLPIWLTEIGWSTGTDQYGVTDETQAVYTGGAIQRALGEWGRYVDKIFVYSWEASGQAHGAADFALRRSDNSARPAWDTIVSLAGGRVLPDPGAPLDQGSDTSGHGGGQRSDDATIVQTVVLTPDDLEQLSASELRQANGPGKFFSDLRVRRSQSSVVTGRGGVHLTVGCAPQCLIDADVFMRIRSNGRSKPELVGRTRFAIPTPGRADVIINLTRQARRKIAKHPNSTHVSLFMTYNGLSGERDKYARSIKFKR